MAQGTPSINLFGFKKVVESMKTSLSDTMVDPEYGRVRTGTLFVTDSLKITFFVAKFVVPLLDPHEEETRWSMEIEWAPSFQMIQMHHIHDPQRAKVLALNTLLDCDDDHFSMRLNEENLVFMYEKLKQVLEAELCTGCKRNIVPNGHIECYSCMMNLQPKDVSKYLCGICKECCIAQIEKTVCCSQYIHRVCRLKWDGDCPYCRAPRQNP